jgi:hypothetical protein
LGAQAQSISLLEQTLAEAQKIDDDFWRSIVLSEIGQGAGSLKDTAQGKVLLEQTLAAAEKVKDEQCRADALAGVAQGAGTFEDTEQALALLQQTEATAQKLSDESSYRITALNGVARGYATLGSQAPSAAAMDKILAKAENLNEQNRAEVLAGVAQGAGSLKDTAQGKALLEEVLTATENIGTYEHRANALAGVAQGAWVLRDTAQGMVLLERTLSEAEKSGDGCGRIYALTVIIENIPPRFFLRQMEENQDPIVRRRMAEDLGTVLDGREDYLSESVRVGGEDTLDRHVLANQITPAVRREAFDENEDVRAAVNSLADKADIRLPNYVERLTQQEISFAWVQSSAIYWLLLLLPEFAVLLGLNAVGGAFVQQDERRSQTANALKIADSRILLRAAGYSDPAVRELLLPMSLTPKELQRVVPERLSRGLDIPLQSILVSACSSPDKATPILTALENRWEALNPEIREGDLRQQAKVLREMLQVVVEDGDVAIQADAQRCLTRLNHFLDVQRTESCCRNGPQRTEIVPPLQTPTKPADGGIEAEASEKREATSCQRIQAQYGSPKREDEVNLLS